ncbi:MAG: hypothetical protein AAB425_07170, partial [Bdellovibrionota bacterium]
MMPKSSLPILLVFSLVNVGLLACKKAPPGSIPTSAEQSSEFTRAIQKLAARSSQEGAQGCDAFAKDLGTALQGIPASGILPDPVKARS